MTGSGKHRSGEEIIRLLHQAQQEQAGGRSLGDFCRQIEVNPGTFSRWKQQYGGMKGPDMRRLKELEKQNVLLKRLVADLELDKLILKEALEGK